MIREGWESRELLDSLISQNPVVELEEGLELTIGSDPEFLIYCGIEPVDPRLINEEGRIFSKGAVEVPDGFLSIDLVAGGELHVARDEYLSSPENHLKGLAKLIYYVPKNFVCPSGKILKIKTNPYLDVPRSEGTKWGRSCGGDIHFGLKGNDRGFSEIIYTQKFKENFTEPFTKLLKEKGIKSIRGCRDVTNKRKGKREKPQTLRVTKNMDPGVLVAYFISFFAGIPLYFLEPFPQRIYRRTKTKYGAFGSWGISNRWGTFEWRFPSTWLYSPNIAKVALSISYAVAYEILHLAFVEEKAVKEAKMDIYSNAIAKPGNLARFDHVEENIEILLEGNETPPENNYKLVLPEVVESIRIMRLYKNYRIDLDRLIELLSRDWNWEVETDTLLNWINVGELERLRSEAAHIQETSTIEEMSQEELESMMSRAESM